MTELICNRNIVVVMLVMCASMIFAQVQEVDPLSERKWLNHTLPLPQEISIRQKYIMSPQDIGIIFPEDAGEVEKTALNQFRQFFKEKTGVYPDGDKYMIIVGAMDENGKVCGIALPDAAKLQQLPNHDQAYLIRSVDENKLVLGALSPAGVYYAVQTLSQLLARDIDQESLAVPFAVVTDWPDMADRGFWNIGYGSPGLVPWLASLKLNFISFGTGIILRPDQPARCMPLPMDIIRQARDYAFLIMPHAPHYDGWRGLAELYPELIGKGDGARNPCYHWGGSFTHKRNPCMANPLLLQRLITEWIESAAEQGVREFSLWLSEHTAQCECAVCLQDGRRQMQKETQASVNAIMAAREKYPDMRGRIFFTLSTRYGSTLDDFRECLAMLPPEIKAEQVYARNEVYDEYARGGNWIVSYNGQPLGIGYFTLRYMADEIRNDVRNYRQAGYSGLLSRGRTGADVDNYYEMAFCNYQYSAMAEWSWNTEGRDVREFAEAWANINDIALPVKFAEWVEIIRPLAGFTRTWEHASGWLKYTDRPDVAGTPRIWTTSLPKPETIHALLEICRQAMPVALEVDDASVLLETHYFQTLLLAMERIHDLCRHSQDAKLNDSDRSARMAEDIQAVKTSLREIGQIREDLAGTPKIASGEPPQIMSRHENWARALLAQFD